MSPSPPEPDLQIAARLLAEGRPAEAAERLGALVAEAPVYAAAHVLLATALEAAGRPGDAAAAWGRAAALVPSSPLVHRERRRLLARTPAADRPAPPPDAADGSALPGAERADGPEAEASPTLEPYGLRTVDERFLRDDDGPEPDDEASDEPAATAAPPEPADPFFGAPTAPSSEPAPSGAELLPPEAPAGADLFGVTPETPAGPGWAVLDEDDLLDEPPGGGAADVMPPEADHPVADELDALIARLQDAPRIRPDPAFSGPAVVFDDAGTDEVASETLAKIYAAQGQYDQAAAVYETLAVRQPERADDLRRQAEALRQRR